MNFIQYLQQWTNNIKYHSANVMCLMGNFTGWFTDTGFTQFKYTGFMQYT